MCPAATAIRAPTSTLAWELLYRLEPELYERMVSAERLHPQIIDWLPRSADRIVEVGAGTGRLTLELIDRGKEVVAIEPAAGLRRILERKLARADHGCRARVSHGFFDDLPVPERISPTWSSRARSSPPPPAMAATPAWPRWSGFAGPVAVSPLSGRTTSAGWPPATTSTVPSLGRCSMEFASHREAVELAEIFYPHAVAEVRRRGSRRVPYELLGINPPRDLAFKVMTG